ncbi:PDDEXK nuclease domain-containing protein [Chryseobacterium sp. RU33C]|uniref:PDDEXK nuclease domain-containing protein n=1 Tax=Chryseobacterium sp. RU33C TaxID=1907398 RepID=UPI0009702AEE|nr:PDDEXK nuclease domain-containing protein [Chryseobacterium sp. RU33C]
MIPKKLVFLGIKELVKELELDKSFSFIGNQYHLEYNNKEYFGDLLFFHRGLQLLLAVELKIGRFKAEHVGKMNLYLSLLDRLERGKNENPSTGIILSAD